MILTKDKNDKNDMLALLIYQNIQLIDPSHIFFVFRYLRNEVNFFNFAAIQLN